MSIFSLKWELLYSACNPMAGGLSRASKCQLIAEKTHFYGHLHLWILYLRFWKIATGKTELKTKDSFRNICINNWHNFQCQLTTKHHMNTMKTCIQFSHILLAIRLNVRKKVVFFFHEIKLVRITSFHEIHNQIISKVEKSHNRY